MSARTLSQSFFTSDSASCLHWLSCSIQPSISCSIVKVKVDGASHASHLISGAVTRPNQCHHGSTTSSLHDR